jgi:hypothetical protein
MATKKAKKTKAKGGKAAKGKKTAKSAITRSADSKPRLSVANFIRDQLERDVEPAKIVAKAAEAFPGKKPTVGYVNWIKANAPKVSTTHNAAASM